MDRSRTKSLTEGAMSLGEFVVDASLNEIRRGGTAIRVKPKSMAVLLRLAESAGEVVDRETLFSSVWGNAQLTDDVLTQAIAEIRRALGDSSRDAQFVQTVPTKGYRLLQPTWPSRGGVRSTKTRPSIFRSPRSSSPSPVASRR